jgi:Ca2+/Na+ antiporter
MPEMHRLITALLFTLGTGSVNAAEVASTSFNTVAITPRESFLAAAIGATIVCGLTSFFLSGRVSERTHVALAMLVVLIGAFSLFALFGLAGREYPTVGAIVFLALIALFKLMNRFEARNNPSRPRG